MNYETNHSPEALAGVLAEVLADLKVVTSVVQGFHWNVKGPDFKEYHAFFSDIYEDFDSSIDPMAENILKLGYDSPYLLQDFLGLTSIQAIRIRSNDPESMVTQLIQHNGALIDCLNGAFHAAEACDEQGIMDFLAGRIDEHKKWQWQLAASLGISVRDIPMLGQSHHQEPMMVEEPVEEPVVGDQFDDLAEFNG
jgi:starvation-inducible DNA-binding protein